MLVYSSKLRGFSIPLQGFLVQSIPLADTVAIPKAYIGNVYSLCFQEAYSYLKLVGEKVYYPRNCLSWQSYSSYVFCVAALNLIPTPHPGYSGKM